MKVVIVGAGRMGLRHATGIAGINQVSGITLIDISDKSLDNARNQLFQTADFSKFNFMSGENFIQDSGKFDIAILASTAQNRIKDIELLQKNGVKHFLIEKPLGQSYQETLELYKYIKANKIDAVVNLNMRLYDCFIGLKNDFNQIAQLKGEKTITINTGTIGIGANGIHYLDLLFFVLGADSAELIAGEIDDSVIYSPRGESFNDFGGWCKINFYATGRYLGKAIISISSQSSVFGVWEILAPNGRITMDEIAQKRIDILRKPDSQLPVYRYAGDYLSPVESKIPSPFLGDLTRKWLEKLMNGENLLPSIETSMGAHKLMFDWLQKSKKFKDKFPIT